MIWKSIGMVFVENRYVRVWIRIGKLGGRKGVWEMF